MNTLQTISHNDTEQMLTVSRHARKLAVTEGFQPSDTRKFFSIRLGEFARKHPDSELVTLSEAIATGAGRVNARELLAVADCLERVAEEMDETRSSVYEVVSSPDGWHSELN